MFLPKDFIIVLIIFAFSSKIQARVDKLKDNVLIIIVDDLRHLSDKSIKLSNIQKLAANGVNFANAFAQQALCAPSRNSILTGRRPDTLRLYDFYSYWRDAVANFTTLPQYFKENGYETYSVGKIFHPGQSSNFTDDYPYSWSHLPYHPPTEIFKDKPVCQDNVTKRLQRNLICPVDVKKQPGHSLPDLQSLEYAIKILKETNRTKPFFLSVGFHKPHIPLKFPEKYLDLVPVQKVHPPRYPYKPANMPSVAWHPWTDVRHRDDIAQLHIPFPYGTMPREWSLKIIQGYYAAALYVDDLIGLLMKHVDTRKTVVVFTSDHGWSLGENGLWAKYSNFDVALKVPLIFNIPGMQPSTISTPVELLDIFPTLVEITGIGKSIPKCRGHTDKSPLCFEGKSLVGLMEPTFENNVLNEDYYAISQYPRPSMYPNAKSDKPRLKDIKIMGYSIRTRQYRYTEWISFNNTLFTKDWDKKYGLELYDHMIDPNEAQNMYLEPKYLEIKKYLSKLLRDNVNKKNNVTLVLNKHTDSYESLYRI